MKRYKDLRVIKYGTNGLTPAQRRGFRRRHHSGPRILHEPPMRHRQQPHWWFPLEEHGSGWKCDTPHCRWKGYGPMLRNVVWRRYFAGDHFRCEPCMNRIMGRPLGPYDLRDCPMNEPHPYFYPHNLSN